MAINWRGIQRENSAWPKAVAWLSSTRSKRSDTLWDWITSREYTLGFIDRSITPNGRMSRQVSFLRDPGFIEHMNVPILVQVNPWASYRGNRTLISAREPEHASLCGSMEVELDPGTVAKRYLLSAKFQSSRITLVNQSPSKIKPQSYALINQKWDISQINRELLLLFGAWFTRHSW